MIDDFLSNFTRKNSRYRAQKSHGRVHRENDIIDYILYQIKRESEEDNQTMHTTINHVIYRLAKRETANANFDRRVQVIIERQCGSTS